MLEEAEYGKRNHLLFPVYIESIEPPYGFSRIQTADLTGWISGTDNSGLLQLTKALRQHLRVINAPFATGENPYQGLTAFKESDTERFFGRDEEIEKYQQQFQSLIDKPLHDSTPARILFVIGPSGSGKSSLVQAGLLPRLRKVFAPPGKGLLHVLVFTPRNRPLRQLAIALARLSPEDTSKATRIHEYEMLLKQKIDGHFNGLADIVDALNAETDSESQASQHLLIVADQFEEIYTQAGQNSAEADMLVSNLLEAAREPRGRIAIIITLRSDFLEQLTYRHKALAGIFSAQAALLGPPTQQGLRQAITVPAASAGSPLNEVVVDQLVEQTLDRNGALPLLQVALGSIWEGMQQGIQPEVTLHQLGGVGGALHEQAEQLFNALNDTEQKLARHALLAMVQIGDSPIPDTRRRIQVDELIADSEHPQQLEQVLLYLSGATTNPSSHTGSLRLITLSSAKNDNDQHQDEEGARYAEIVHEALLQRWKRLKAWIDTNRDNLRIRERIRDRMQVWQENKCPNDRLLPSGSELEDGRKLLTVDKDIPISDIKPYIQRSITHRQRNARIEKIVWGSVTTLLAGFLYWALISEQEAQQNLLSANFKSANFYEERSLNALTDAHDNNDTGHYRAAWLYALEAALLPIPAEKQALSEETIGALLFGGLIRNAFNEYWFSPSMDLGDSLGQAAISSDGRLLAVGQGQKGAFGLNKQLFFWDIASGQLVRRFEDPKQGPISGLAFSPDNQFVATVSRSNNIFRAQLWDLNSGNKQHVLEQKDDLYDLKFFPDGQRLAISSSKGILEWTPNDTDTEIRHFKTEVRPWAFDLDASGKWLAVSNDSNKALIYAIDSDELIHTFKPIDESIDLARKSEWLQSSLGISPEETSKRAAGVVYLVNNITFSPDTSLLAITDSNHVNIMKIQTEALWRQLKQDGGMITSLAFRPDSLALAAGNKKGVTHLWSLNNDREVEVLQGHSDSVNGIAFTPDGKYLATVSSDRSARIWDAGTGKPIQPGDGHWGVIYSIAGNPDGQLVASGSIDKTVRLWNVATGQLVSTFEGHSSNIFDVKFDSAGNILASGSYDGTVRIWDAINHKLLHVLSPTTGDEKIEVKGISNLSFSHDGTLLAASSENTAFLWSVTNGKLLKRFNSKYGAVWTAFDSNSNTLNGVTIDDDLVIRFWDMLSGKVLHKFDGASLKRLSGLGFDPTGQIFATTDYDYIPAKSAMHLWDVHNGQLLRAIPMDFGSDRIAFTSNGSLIAAPKNNQVYMWNTATGDLDRIVNTDCQWMRSIAFSSDDQMLLAGCEDKTLRMINAGGSAAKLTLNKTKIDSTNQEARFSPDGNKLALAGMSPVVELWDTHSGHLTRELPSQSVASWDIAFHPNQPWLAVGSNRSPVSVWNATSGELLQRFDGNSMSQGFIVSPDGRFIATLSPDTRSLILWDIQRGALHHTIDIRQQNITDFTFSPDSQTIAVTSFNRSKNGGETVSLWNIATAENSQTLPHEQSANSVVFSTHGGTLLFSPDGGGLLGGSSSNFWLWNVNTESLMHSFDLGAGAHSTVQLFSPDGALIAFFDPRGNIHLWETGSGAKVDTFAVGQKTRGMAQAIQFLSNNLLMVAGGQLEILNTQTKEWLTPDEVLEAVHLNEQSGTNQLSLPAWMGGLLLVKNDRTTVRAEKSALSPNGQWLASAGENESIQIRSLQNDTLIKQIGHHAGILQKIAFTPDGKKIITQYYGAYVNLWDIDAGQLLGKPIEYGEVAGSDRLERIVFSPNGYFLAAQGPNGQSIQIRKIPEGTLHQTLPGDKHTVTHLAFTPDNQKLITGARESLKVWNVETGDLIEILPTGSSMPPNALAISPDGKFLASNRSGITPDEIYLWNMESLPILHVLKNGSGSLAFSPDSRILAADTGESEVALWDVTNGQRLHTIPGKIDESGIGAFSPDSRVIATRLGNGALIFWDTRTGNKLHELPGNHPFSFSPDGQSFVAGIGGEQNGVNIWPLEAAKLWDLLAANTDQQRAVLSNLKQASEFLWQRRVDGLNIVDAPHQPRLYPHNGYFFEHENRMRPLLDPPSPGQSKFDQVYQWAIEQTK